MYMYTLVRVSMSVDQGHIDFHVVFMQYKTLAYFVILDLEEFYIILGMSW